MNFQIASLWPPIADNGIQIGAVTFLRRLFSCANVNKTGNALTLFEPDRSTNSFIESVPLGNPLPGKSGCIRRHQKILLAVFGVAIMIIFVLGTALDKIMSSPPGGGGAAGQVVSWKHGSLNESQFRLIKQRQSITNRPIRRARNHIDRIYLIFNTFFPA